MENASSKITDSIDTHHRRLDKLGAGAFGQVYRVQNIQTNTVHLPINGCLTSKVTWIFVDISSSPGKAFTMESGVYGMTMTNWNRPNGLLANINHVNIVRLYGYTNFKGQQTISLYMELCDGNIFDYARMSNGEQVSTYNPQRSSRANLFRMVWAVFTPGFVHHIAVSILNGLEHLHSQDPHIVHSDIKPRNGMPNRFTYCPVSHWCCLH